MYQKPAKSPYRKAFTLLEMTLVIGLVVGMTSLSVFGLTVFSTISKAHKAEALMRQIENARLSYLMDNPTQQYGGVTGDKIDQYLPGGWDATKELLDANGYTITEGGLQSATISYTLNSGTAGASWASKVRGFACSNCGETDK